jgi:hypothetical protein
MTLKEKIEFDLYMIRQMIDVAKEAKANKWSLEGMAPEFRETSPGDIYEFHMRQIPKTLKMIEGNIKKLEGNHEET